MGQMLNTRFGIRSEFARRKLANALTYQFNELHKSSNEKSKFTNRSGNKKDLFQMTVVVGR